MNNRDENKAMDGQLCHNRFADSQTDLKEKQTPLNKKSITTSQQYDGNNIYRGRIKSFTNGLAADTSPSSFSKTYTYLLQLHVEIPFFPSIFC